MAGLKFAILFAGALASLLFGFAGCDAATSDGAASAGTIAVESAPENQLSVHAARIRAVPPGVQVSAAYMQLVNRTAEDDRLIAVRMAGAGRMEIHETIVDGGGVMRMRPLQQGLALPAGRSVELKPGGAHIMLMQLTVEPRAGDTIELECNFAVAGTRKVSARVFDAE